MSVCSPYRSLTDTKSLLASGEEEDKRGEDKRGEERTREERRRTREERTREDRTREERRGRDRAGNSQLVQGSLATEEGGRGGVYEGRLCPDCSAVVLKAVLTVVKQQQRQKKEIGIFFL